MPFDRHDWVVDRDGEEIRYVIDFYSGHESKQASSNNDAVSMYLDVRPAVDSFGSVIDRIYMGFLEAVMPSQITTQYIPGYQPLLDGVLSIFKKLNSQAAPAIAYKQDPENKKD